VKDYVALSERSVQMLRRYLPSDSRFYPMRNATDIKKEPQVSVVDNSDVVFVGRLEKEKGVLLLAEAAKSLGQRIIFVGDGSLRAALESYPGVTVTGWLGSFELAEWLNRARCLVFPSLWYETYGLVVDEAAARGIPVIVSDVTAAAERVEDGVTGWHFRSGNLLSLRERMRTALEAPNINEMGCAAYARFWDNSPTEITHAANLIEIYKAALDRASSTKIAPTPVGKIR
jgi:glycosyltransferase involved in cell wall biosynthesis